MQARITKAFRIVEGEGTRKYTPGDVAEGDSAAFAIEHGFGETIDEPKAKPAPANKSKKAQANK